MAKVCKKVQKIYTIVRKLCYNYIDKVIHKEGNNLYE